MAKLIVQFTGLCLHVKHPDNKQGVAVLMPDGRFLGDPKKHADGTDATPHAGYIRMDLRNLVAGAAGFVLPNAERPGRFAPTDGPFFETLYRIGSLDKGKFVTGQTLDFGLPAPAAPIDAKPELPNLDEVAPNIPLRAGLFTKLGGATLPSEAPPRGIPSPLLFRTLLLGGTLESVAGTIDESWSIDRRLNQKAAHPIVSPFAGESVWTREIPAEGITLTLTDFDGSNAMKIPLTPVNGEIRLKIANLCADNPIEWDEFFIRTGDMEDSDFKWFYELLEPPEEAAATTRATPQNWGNRWRNLLQKRLLPAPRIISQHQQLNGGPPFDCAEGEKTEAFAPLASWSQ
jgi:hypothetical protein